MRIDIEGDRMMTASLRDRAGRRPWLRLLGSVLQLAGEHAELLRHTERPWASVTFSGARHTVLLTFNGVEAMNAADDFIASLPEYEFSIQGQLVADATITSVEQESLPQPKITVEAELLLLENI